MAREEAEHLRAVLVDPCLSQIAEKGLSNLFLAGINSVRGEVRTLPYQFRVHFLIETAAAGGLEKMIDRHFSALGTVFCAHTSSQYVRPVSKLIKRNVKKHTQAIELDT